MKYKHKRTEKKNRNICPKDFNIPLKISDMTDEKKAKILKVLLTNLSQLIVIEHSAQQQTEYTCSSSTYGTLINIDIFLDIK
jgi:hypothetical protein